MNPYVIYSPGRTGSHIILEALAGPPNKKGGLCNTIPYWHPRDSGSFNCNSHHVIHTHNLNVITELNLDPTTVTLILSRRRDIFSQTISWFVAEIAKEWNGKDYTNKTLVPVNIDAIKFVNLFERYKSWPDQLSVDQFKKVVTIYYEDIIEHGLDHIVTSLELVDINTQPGVINQKSPYHYTQCILNWQELKKIADDIISNK